VTTELRPALARTLPHYSWPTALADAIAGITVGLVALPLAMAFAISSGLPPQSGIYCAIVTGFIVSLCGGSRTQIAGPTGAFVVVVAAIVEQHGVDGLLVCTMIAGGLLITMGLAGLGSTVRFIPRPVVVGFTNGIAVIIASTQIRDFFGLQIDSVPNSFVLKVEALTQHAGSWSAEATALAAGTLTIIIVVNRFTRIPGTIVALFAGTIAATVLRLEVATIGSQFGGIPTGLPRLALPHFRPALLPELAAPAVTVAMLGAIESLMSATVADRMSRDRHNSNMELIAQGLANLVSPLVGGLPATGAIARTATNIRSGARTPVAGMIHSVTLLAVLLLAAPLAAAIPLSVLAAILFVVAWKMGEWHEIPQLLRLSRTEVSVWIVTFGLTVFADLTAAVEVGMMLAALLFIRRVALTTSVMAVTDEHIRSSSAHSLLGRAVPSYVRLYRVQGPFLFGATDKLLAILDDADSLPDIIIVRLGNMTALDATGLQAFEELADGINQAGRDLIFCGARGQPATLMQRAEFHRHVGGANICANVEAALERASVLHHHRTRMGPAATTTTEGIPA
jgi:sulfate permease, SulP family